MRALRALAAVAVTAAIVAMGMLSAGAAVRSGPAPRRAVLLSARGCPAGIRGLPAAGVQHAADQALAQAAKLYRG